MSTDTHERTWTHDGRPELNRRGLSVDGPWTAEPDKIHWIDPDTDMDCLMLRNGMGAWCGYVAVPPGHPFHGVGYDHCAKGGCEDGEEWCYCDHSPNSVVEVHGGLTYSAFCRESDDGEGHGICHVPLPGRPADVWWLGFDTAHSGDLTPYDAAQRDQERDQDGERLYWSFRRDDVYRDLSYVKSECASLARQLAAVSS